MSEILRSRIDRKFSTRGLIPDPSKPQLPRPKDPSLPPPDPEPTPSPDPDPSDPAFPRPITLQNRSEKYHRLSHRSQHWPRTQVFRALKIRAKARRLQPST